MKKLLQCPTKLVKKVDLVQTPKLSDSARIVSDVVLLVMTELRTVLPNDLIKKLRNDSSLLDLVEKGWLDVVGIYALVKNAINKNGQKHKTTFEHADKVMFVKILQKELDLNTLGELGIAETTTNHIIQRIRKIQKILKSAEKSNKNELPNDDNEIKIKDKSPEDTATKQPKTQIKKEKLNSNQRLLFVKKQANYKSNYFSSSKSKGMKFWDLYFISKSIYIFCDFFQDNESDAKNLDFSDNLIDPRVL